jgi:hypothetical protein
MDKTSSTADLAGTPTVGSLWGRWVVAIFSELCAAYQARRSSMIDRALRLGLACID